MSLIQLRECLFHWTESRKVKPGSLLLSESDSTISASQRILHLSGRISYSLGFRWFTLISWGDKEVCSSLKDVFSGHSIVKPLVRSFVYEWEEICLFFFFFLPFYCYTTLLRTSFSELFSSQFSPLSYSLMLCGKNEVCCSWPLLHQSMLGFIFNSLRLRNGNQSGHSVTGDFLEWIQECRHILPESFRRFLLFSVWSFLYSFLSAFKS